MTNETDSAGQIARATLYLDVLLRLSRRGLSDADVRFLFRLYGPVLVRTERLRRALLPEGSASYQTGSGLQSDFDSVLAAVNQAPSVEDFFERFDDYARRHDPFDSGEALTTVVGTVEEEEPAGVAFVRGLLSYSEDGSGLPAIGPEQQILLESLLAHASRPEGAGLLKEVPAEFSQGDEVVTAGARSTDVFIVIDGELRVVVDGVVVGRRLAGAVVGEMALLFDGVRTGTVSVASRDARVLRVPREAFAELLQDRVFLAAYAEIVARRSNHGLIGDVEERRRLDGVSLADIGADSELLEQQRIAFETLTRRRHIQGSSWSPMTLRPPEADLAEGYLAERVRLGRLLAWDLGLDALAIQYAPDFAAETKVVDGRPSALTRADTMGQLKLMELVKEKFPITDRVVGEEEVGADLFSDDVGESADYRWIVDPIDGTRAYGAGGDEWGVHVYCEFRVRRRSEGEDDWIPLLCVKFAPRWNAYDDKRGGLMATWHRAGPVTMNGEVWAHADRQERVNQRHGELPLGERTRILCGSHPRLPFVVALPRERFAVQGKYNSGLIQSLEFDLGLIDLLSIGSPTGNRTKPHDAFTTFSAVGFGGAIGVFDFSRDANGSPQPARAGMDAEGHARTIAGEEPAVRAFLEAIEGMGTD